MNDSPFRLQDKSVMIYGDFNNLTQSLIREFTTQGADVAFVNTQKPQTGRFLENVNDAREVHQQYGRAAQIDVAIKDKKTSFDAVSRMAELFGRIDVLVDAKMSSLSDEGAGFDNSQFLIEEVAPFFKSKKRGRIVFVREDESAGPLLPNGLVTQLTEKFVPWTKTLSSHWPAPGFGVNMVSVGLTEDLLLKKYPAGRSIRSTLETLQKEHPRLQMVDSNEITSVVLFLSSTAASGVSGQNLRVARNAS